MTFSEAMAQFSAFDGVAVPEPTSLSLLASLAGWPWVAAGACGQN